MDRVRLPEDERLHRSHRHEWWYFCAWLTQPSTGRSFHYTTALMRDGPAWVSYYRWWPSDADPVLHRAVHVPTRRGPDPELWVGPRVGWDVLLGGGRSAHHLGPISLYFSDAGIGPCLHTTHEEGGICRYGGPNEMAWYSWPHLAVRGRLQAGGGARNALTGIGWMEHQWGGTDFRELTWRYLPVLLSGPAQRRLIAYRYVHRDHPTEPSLAVAWLDSGAATRVVGGTLHPSGPGEVATRIDLGASGHLLCEPRSGGEIDLGLPLVPRFHESPSRVSGSLDGVAVTGVAMTEFLTA